MATSNLGSGSIPLSTLPLGEMCDPKFLSSRNKSLAPSKMRRGRARADGHMGTRITGRVCFLPSSSSSSSASSSAAAAAAAVAANNGMLPEVAAAAALAQAVDVEEDEEDEEFAVKM